MVSACTRSMPRSRRGASSRVLARTLVRMGDALALLSREFCAVASAARPMPARSWRYRSKPPNWPRPRTVGRLTEYACASWMLRARMRLAQPMKVAAVSRRWSHGLRRTKSRPTFSPWPTKLKPAISMTASTSGLWCMSSPTRVMTFMVRSSVVPGGVCTIT